MAGTQAAYLALVALVYRRTDGSGAWIAAALAASLAARVAVSPWAGALGDRFDRRLVMIASDLVAAGCFVGLAFASDPVALVLLAGLASAAEAPFGPASGALIVMLVPESQRAWANSLRAAGSSLGSLVGGVSGGLLVAALGASAAFYVNAASFVGSAVLVSTIRGSYRAVRTTDSEHRGVLAGIRLLWRLPVLRISTCSLGLVLLGLGMVNVAEYPFFVLLGAGSTGFGVAITAWAGGQVVGSRLLRHLAGARAERGALIAGCGLASLALGVSGAWQWFPAIALVFVAGGIGATFAGVASSMIAQRWAPDEVRGRTLAAVEAVASAALGASLLAGGVLLGPLGPANVFLLAGGIGLVATSLALRVPPNSRTPLPEPVPAERAEQPQSHGLAVESA